MQHASLLTVAEHRLALAVVVVVVGAGYVWASRQGIRAVPVLSQSAVHRGRVCMTLVNVRQAGLCRVREGEDLSIFSTCGVQHNHSVWPWPRARST